MSRLDPYLDPELHDAERPCRSCERHQGECDGPPARCCEACEHWTALPQVWDDPITEEQHAETWAAWQTPDPEAAA